MSHFSIYWLLVLAIALAVVQIVIGAMRAMRRARNFAAMANELGMAFTPWIGPAAAPKIGTELFRMHPGGAFKNVMTGNYAGLQVQVFEFSYMGGSTANSTANSEWVAVYTQDVDLPVFRLQPKNLILGIVDRIQNQRVELDSPAGASPHYMVHGPDKERIQALFNAGILSFVEGLDRSKRWHIEGAGKQLAIYRYEQRMKPEHIKDFLQETSSIAESFFGCCQAAAAQAADQSG